MSTGCTALGVGSGLWLASEEYELAKSSLVIVTEAKFLAVRDIDCEGLLGVIEGESGAGGVGIEDDHKAMLSVGVPT